MTEYVLQEGALPGAAHGAARGLAARRDRDPAERRRRAVVSSPMFVLIVGAGRVGSSLARAMLREGHEVSCLDEDPESHARLEIGLEQSWEDLGGQFTVGTALEIEALRRPGSSSADVFVASTDGDNTNIVIAQIAKRRFKVPTVIARILDPLPGRVVRAAGPAHDLPDPGGDRHARDRGQARPPPAAPRARGG